MDFTPALIGALFFIMVCITMYRIGCIRADVGEIKKLLKEQAAKVGEPRSFEVGQGETENPLPKNPPRETPSFISLVIILVVCLGVLLILSLLKQ